MRWYWQYRRRWSDEYQPGATPGRSAISKGEVIHMTTTKVAQQLIHAALDVVAPLERFSYLSGVLDGYKLAREEIEGQQFRVQNKDDMQEHSRV